MKRKLICGLLLASATAFIALDYFAATLYALAAPPTNIVSYFLSMILILVSPPMIYIDEAGATILFSLAVSIAATNYNVDNIHGFILHLSLIVTFEFIHIATLRLINEIEGYVCRERG